MSIPHNFQQNQFFIFLSQIVYPQADSKSLTQQAHKSGLQACYLNHMTTKSQGQQFYKYKHFRSQQFHLLRLYGLAVGIVIYYFHYVNHMACLRLMDQDMRKALMKTKIFTRGIFIDRKNKFEGVTTFKSDYDKIVQLFEIQQMLKNRKFGDLRFLSWLSLSNQIYLYPPIKQNIQCFEIDLASVELDAIYIVISQKLYKVKNQIKGSKTYGLFEIYNLQSILFKLILKQQNQQICQIRSFWSISEHYTVHMKQTIKFLDVLDIERKRSQTLTHQTTPFNKHSIIGINTTGFKNTKSKLKSLMPLNTKKNSLNSSAIFQDNSKTNIAPFTHNNMHTINKNSHKFPFFKALHFNESKFEQYPEWLTTREDFMSFMYKNYESKLLLIPKICEKQPKNRASDQRYFVSLYLQQIDIFQSLPPLIMDSILEEIKTKKYQAGQTIHDENENMKFMAVIFIGSVQYSKGRNVIKKQRNQILMSQAFYKTHHSSIVAKQETVLLCLDKRIYKTIQSQLKQDIFEKNRAQISDMMKSDFFVELHLKQKRANTFYQGLTPQFFFKNQQICQAGQQAQCFYLHFKGQILEQNHIYIREHNKWPLPNKRWEVRAVYNSYQNESYLKQFSFFGDEEIIGKYKFKSSYYAKSFCILYSMPADNFKTALTVQDFKRLKKYRNEHVDINYGQFEQKVRNKVNSEIQKKKIVHKAINTSFINKTLDNLSPRKTSLLENIEKNMLSQTFSNDRQNQENQIFFK